MSLLLSSYHKLDKDLSTLTWIASSPNFLIPSAIYLKIGPKDVIDVKWNKGGAPNK